MLCCGLISYVKLYFVMTSYAMLCYVMLCGVVTSYVMLYCIVLWLNDVILYDYVYAVVLCYH